MSAPAPPRPSDPANLRRPVAMDDPEWEVPHTGPATAASLAAGLGLLALGSANLLSSVFQPFEETLTMASRFFFPGGDQITAYGGKELVALITWLLSWLILHFSLRRRHTSLTSTAAVFVFCLMTSTLFFWPPIIRLITGLLRTVIV